jgi:hypothetical protein
MIKRGYNHNSNLDKRLAAGLPRQTEYIDSYKKQFKILKNKKCGCRIS